MTGPDPLNNDIVEAGAHQDHVPLEFDVELRYVVRTRVTASYLHEATAPVEKLHASILADVARTLRPEELDLVGLTISAGGASRMAEL